MVAAGAALDSASRSGQTALMYGCQAAGAGGTLSARRVVKALLAGLGPNGVLALLSAKDCEGWTPLHYVRSNAYEAMLTKQCLPS